jgi:hypothetical protein
MYFAIGCFKTGTLSVIGGFSLTRAETKHDKRVVDVVFVFFEEPLTLLIRNFRFSQFQL